MLHQTGGRAPHKCFLYAGKSPSSHKDRIIESLLSTVQNILTNSHHLLLGGSFNTLLAYPHSEHSGFVFFQDAAGELGILSNHLSQFGFGLETDFRLVQQIL